MKLRAKKFEVAIVIVAIAALVAIWAMNGYEDTWLYVAAIIIAIPASWFFFGKKSEDQ